MRRAQSVLQVSLTLLAFVLVLPSASSQEQQKCASIQAADGTCADPKLVEMANRRASIVSTQFTSYLGSPFGSVGMPFIPQERLFRDDTILFGVPTSKSVTKTDVIEFDPIEGKFFVAGTKTDTRPTK